MSAAHSYGGPGRGGKYPYSHDPHAEHLLPNTAIPVIPLAALALGFGLVVVGWMTWRGWWD